MKCGLNTDFYSVRNDRSDSKGDIAKRIKNNFTLSELNSLG